MSINIKNELTLTANKLESALESCFSTKHNNELTDAMKYSLLGGGKRIRAFLTLTFAKIYGATEEAAMPFACAIEMIQAYSLIHDDLPCMDDDDMRRGKPSCHKQFDEATALLAGDSLLTQAFEVCALNDKVSALSIANAVRILADLAGYKGMCGGQEIDLSDSVNSFNDLKNLHLLKTSALIKASCLLGLYAAVDTPSKNDIKAISDFADCLGVAFQIHDDILDVISTSEVLGKPVGSDSRNDKKTVFAFMNLDEARAAEKEFTDKAIKAVSACPDGQVPTELALWLLARNK